MKIAVFPGSFDPVTLGHESLVKRALPLFDKIIIAIGNNSEKAKYFTLEQRKLFLEKTFGSLPNVEIEIYNGLTIDFCINKNAQYILRGLRSVADFDYEKNIAQINHNLQPEIETVFLFTNPEFTPITSTIAREIHKYGGDVKRLVPSAIHGII